MANSLDELLPPVDQERVLAAIRSAEARTSGQVKVHLEGRCIGPARRRAERVFLILGLERTQHRNAVLLYVAVRDHKYAILGDTGIHEAVGGAFWDAAAAQMKDAFARGALGDGLVGAIEAIGEKLAERFPPAATGNEIPDDISH